MPSGFEVNGHDLDALFAEYFGAADQNMPSREDRSRGLIRLQADFAQALEPARRIALWLVLFRVGAAPCLEATFPDDADRVTAGTMADILAITGCAPAWALGRALN